MNEKTGHDVEERQVAETIVVGATCQCSYTSESFETDSLLPRCGATAENDGKHQDD